jgi:hypothetical protein
VLGTAAFFSGNLSEEKRFILSPSSPLQPNGSAAPQGLNG